MAAGALLEAEAAVEGAGAAGLAEAPVAVEERLALGASYARLQKARRPVGVVAQERPLAFGEEAPARRDLLGLGPELRLPDRIVRVE